MAASRRDTDVRVAGQAVAKKNKSEAAGLCAGMAASRRKEQQTGERNYARNQSGGQENAPGNGPGGNKSWRGRPKIHDGRPDRGNGTEVRVSDRPSDRGLEDQNPV